MASRSRVLPALVRDEMAARISSGEWRPGQRLPSEPELAASFGVSRSTLREALRSLEEDGFLTRARRAGTFVTHRPRLLNNLDVNFGVTDLIRSMGLRPGTENLKSYRALATEEEAKRLSLPPSAPVAAPLSDRHAPRLPRHCLPVLRDGGVEKFRIQRHRRAWFACLSWDQVWLGRRHE
jgi:GntR family transcriptional regulator